MGEMGEMAPTIDGNNSYAVSYHLFISTSYGSIKYRLVYLHAARSVSKYSSGAYSATIRFLLIAHSMRVSTAAD